MSSRSVNVTPERLSGWLQRFATRHGPIELTGADPTHLQIRSPDGATADLIVPFPPLARPERVEDLIEHASRDRSVGVLLVRRGGYAVGHCVGRTLVASKVGSGYVQGRTKAGGWSQQRFARRRANQAESLWGGAAEVTVRILLPLARELDALVTGGDAEGVTKVLADSRLAPLVPLLQPGSLTVPDPKLVVLAATPDQFRAVRIELNELA